MKVGGSIDFDKTSSAANCRDCSKTCVEPPSQLQLWFFFIKGLEHSERQAFRKTWLFVFISFVCTQKKKSTKNLFELDEMVRFTLWEDESPDPEKKKQ